MRKVTTSSASGRAKATEQEAKRLMRRAALVAKRAVSHALAALAVARRREEEAERNVAAAERRVADAERAAKQVEDAWLGLAPPTSPPTPVELAELREGSDLETKLDIAWQKWEADWLAARGLDTPGELGKM